MRRVVMTAMLAAAVLMVTVATPNATRAQVDSAEVVDISATWDKRAARPGDQRVLAIHFRMDEGFHINPDPDRLPQEQQFTIPTTIEVAEAGEGLTLGPVQWPVLHDIKVQYTSPPREVPAIADGAVAYLPVTISDDAEAGERAVSVNVRFQSCDDKKCYAPTTQKMTVPLTLGDDATVAAAESGDSSLFDGFDRGVFAKMKAGYTAPDYITFNAFGLLGEGVRVNAGTWLGFAATLVIAAIGGLLLNFTPCVLPVIPLKIMGLAQSAGHRGRTLLLGGIMAGGVAVFWMVLGGAIAGTGYAIQRGLLAEGAGISAANELFQFPAFTVTVGIIIALMAVGMCGLFTIQLPQWVYLISPRQDSILGSFGFGIMTAVLSTPCTAPFMGAAAGWAAGQPAGVTMSTFLAIGVGMALPYFVLSAWPRLAERMPRTGPGSELLKQVLGLLMLAAAAFFVGSGLSVMFNQPPDPASLVYWWVVGGFVAAAGGWLIARTFRITRRTGPRAVWTVVGVIFLLSAGAGASSLDDRGPIDWQYYTSDRFRAAQASDQVVVMDFTADWCLNCKALERAVLFDKRVVRAIDQPGVVPMKVDLTSDKNKAGQAMLKKMGRATIPLLVVFAPDGEPVFKSDAYQVSQVLHAIDRARSGDSPKPAKAAMR